MSEQEKIDAKEAANKKAIELGTSMGCKVHTLIVEKPDEIVVGYLKEPTLATKMLAVNYLGQKQVDLAGDAILMTCLIKEQSDSRFNKPSSEEDVYVSAVLACNTLINVYGSEIKKN